jgi:hypothetical protein
MIDDDYAPNAGSVIMDQHHLLVVSADKRAGIAPRDRQLARALQTLLQHPTVDGARHYLTTIGEFRDTAEIDVRLQAVERAVIDPVHDAPALRTLDHALEGHVLMVDSGVGSLHFQNPAMVVLVAAALS